MTRSPSTKLVSATTSTPRQLRADHRGRSDAIELRHQQVHEHDVRPQLARRLDAEAPVLRLADDLDIVEQLQVAAQSPPNDAVVVDEEDPDRAGGAV